MSKRQVYLFCVLITTLGWIYYKINTLKPAPPLKTNSSNISNVHTKSLLNWQGQSIEQEHTYPTQSSSKMDIKYIMAGSYISPFSQHSNPDNLSSNYSAAKTEFKAGLKVVTYSNLNNLSESAASSRYICPPETPFAENYTLVNPLSNMQVYARGYRNACSLDGGGKAFSDLLYGDDQHVDPNNGRAITMSAFIPNTTPEGCNKPEYNFLIPLDIPESAVQVTPIYATATLERQIIGYQQTQQIQVNCLSICNKLINTYCKQFGENMGYCDNIVINAYFKTSIYLARNIPENFCACSISQMGATWSFTNAVDIESLIQYNNPLYSVTCSNYTTAD